jgi:hypothetical protein
MFIHEPCPACQGTGKEYLDDGFGALFPVTCSQCEGHGFILIEVAEQSPPADADRVTSANDQDSEAQSLS